MMNKPRIEQSGRKDLDEVAVPGFDNNLMQRERRPILGRLTSVWFRLPGKVWWQDRVCRGRTYLSEVSKMKPCSACIIYLEVPMRYLAMLSRQLGDMHLEFWTETHVFKRYSLTNTL